MFCHGILRFIPGILLRKCSGNPAWCIFLMWSKLTKSVSANSQKLLNPSSLLLIRTSDSTPKRVSLRLASQKCFYFVYHKIFGWSLRKAVFIVVTTMLKQTALSKWCYCSEKCMWRFERIQDGFEGFFQQVGLMIKLVKNTNCENHSKLYGPFLHWNNLKK